MMVTTILITIGFFINSNNYKVVNQKFQDNQMYLEEIREGSRQIEITLDETLENMGKLKKLTLEYSRTIQEQDKFIDHLEEKIRQLEFENEYLKTNQISYYDIPLSKELQKYVMEKAKEYNLDHELVLAVMSLESSFNPSLISRTNDYGLMQINKVNHARLKKEVGVKDFLNPYDSIDAGIFMLGELHDRYKDTHQILMAYNFGDGGMKKVWDNGVRSSKYSRAVMGRKDNLKKVGV